MQEDCEISNNKFVIKTIKKRGKNMDKTIAKGRLYRTKDMTRIEVEYKAGRLIDFVLVSLLAALPIGFNISKAISTPSFVSNFSLRNEIGSVSFLAVVLAIIIMMLLSAHQNVRKLHKEVLIAINGFSKA